MEGLTLTSFCITLFYNIYFFEKGKKLSWSWVILFYIPLIKNVLLLPDLYFLVSKGQYSYFNIPSLLSNIAVWAISIYAFQYDHHSLFGSLNFDSVI